MRPGHALYEKHAGKCKFPAPRALPPVISKTERLFALFLEIDLLQTRPACP